MRIGSKTFGRKVLSVLCAIAIILSVATVAFSTLAGTGSTVYEISPSAPAIPMTAWTKVDLENIAVKFTDGYKNGEGVTWAVDASVSADALKIDGNYLVAYTKGAYKLTASYGTESVNVFAVVKEENDSEYVLYETTFGDYSSTTEYGVTSFPSEWKSQLYAGEGWHIPANSGVYGQVYTDFTGVVPYDCKVGTVSLVSTQGPGIVPFANFGKFLDPAPNIYGAAGYFTLNDPVVNEFADYTITASMIGYSHFGGDDKSGTGIFGRADVDANGKLYKTEKSFTALMAQTNTNRLFSLTSANSTNAEYSTAWLTGGENNGSWSYLSGKNKELQTLSVKYSGTTATLFSPDDTSKKTFTATVENKKGAVGIATKMISDTYTASWVNVRSFKVTLNSDIAVPTAVDLGYYVISPDSPAIPMNVLTKAKMSEVIVKIGNKQYLGDKLDFTTTDTTGAIVIDNTEHTITANGTGTFKVTATVKADPSKSTTLYAVVKDTAETDFIIYTETFTENVIPSNWKVQYVKGNAERFQTTTVGKEITVKTIEPLTDGERVSAYTGVVPFYGNELSGEWWYTRGYMILNDEAVSSFKNYKISAEMYADGRNYGGSGIVGRVENNASGELDASSSLIGAWNDNRHFPADDRGYAKATKMTSGTISNIGAAATAWDYALTDRVNNIVHNLDFQKYTLEFNGDKATFSTPDRPGQDYTFSADGKAGDVGVYTECVYDGGASAWLKLHKFTVALNSGTVAVPSTGIVTGDYITVTESNPYITVAPNGSVNLENVFFSINGIYKNGRDIQFTSANGFTVSGSTLTAASAGLYKTEVKSGVDTLTVYILVKDNSGVPDDGYFDNGNYKFTVENGTIKGYSKLYDELPYSEKVIFPATYEGNTIATIGVNLFKDKAYTNTIKSAVFSEGINKIEGSSFVGTSGLSQVYFPSTLTFIGDWAFLSSGVTSLDFTKCPAVEIDSYAFKNCNELVSLKLGNNMTSVSNGAFGNCAKLNEVILPYSVTKIGNNAFTEFREIDYDNVLQGNKDLVLTVYNRNATLGTNVVFADSEDIANSATIKGATGSTAEAYATANNINFIAIDDIIEQVERDEQARLEAINRENELKATTADTGAEYKFSESAGQYYLAGANNIGTIDGAYCLVFPSTTTYYNKNGNKVDIGSEKPVVGVSPNAFKNDSNISKIYGIVIPEGYTTVGDSAFIGASNIRKITFPSTLTSIADWAFNGNVKLTTITLPNSLTKIGNSTFAGSKMLETVNLDIENSTLSTIGNNAFANTAIKSIALPLTTSSIGNNAFANSSLTEITIHNKAATIGSTAFPKGTVIHGVQGSTAQKYVDDNPTMNYTFVGDVTDYLAQKLSTPDPNPQFTVSSTGTSYVYSKYEGQGGLVIFPAQADYTDPKTGAVTPGVLISAVEGNCCKFSASKSLIFAVKIEEGITRVGDSAFNACPNLMQIELPTTITKIEDYAFSFCPQLSGTVKLYADCTSIGTAAFTRTQISEIYVYNKNCTIGSGAFPAGATIYGIKDSTAQKFVESDANIGKQIEDTQAKYDAEQNEEEKNKIKATLTLLKEKYLGLKFVEIQPLPEKTIRDIEDNKNYGFKLNASGDTITEYYRTNTSAAYSPKVVFPGKVNGKTITKIDSNLFKGKAFSNSIQAAIFEEGITTIGDSAFIGCGRLKFVQFPSTLEKIEQYAFQNTALAGDIVFGEKVKIIGGNAFSGCAGITSVTITNPTASISSSAFSGVGKGFVVKGLTNSTAEQFAKKNRYTFVSIGTYNPPLDDDDTDSDETKPGKNPGDTQQNRDDDDLDNNTTSVVSEDLTLIIVIVLAALFLIIVLGTAVVVVVAVKASQRDNDEDDDEEEEIPAAPPIEDIYSDTGSNKE